METISAKEIVNIYKLRWQRLIDIVRSGKVTIYDEDDRVVSLQQHQRTFEERIFDYTPVDIQGYFDAFDFGSSPIEEVKQDIIKYENKKVEEAKTEVEYNLIVEKYYFGEIEFDKVYKEMYPSTKDRSNASMDSDTVIDGKHIINIPASIWAGLPVTTIYNNMKGNYHDCIIAKVLMDNKDSSFSKMKVGELFYELTDKAKEDSTLRDKVDKLLAEFDKKYIIKYK